VNDAAAGAAAPTLCNDTVECTADECNGTGGCQNPALAGGTPCGNPADTECTDPDTCNGSGACLAHDASAGAPALVLCNDALECTTDECNGSGGCQNPPLASGLACGDPAPSLCSAADTCDGAGACSANDFADGTACEDGDLCTTGDECTGGACMSTPTDCDDADPCTYDRCDAGTGDCLQTDEPRPDCRAAAAQAFSVVNNPASSKRNLLKWKWIKGEQTDLDEFGTPITAAQYDLCVFDFVASAPSLATHMTLAPNALWQSKKNFFRYKDKTGALDGFVGMRLSAGTTGRAKLSLVAKGLNLPAPVPVDQLHFFELDPHLTVQLSNDAGVCWSSEFDRPYKNTGIKFKTKRKVLVN
jgi:hypothetical protein